MPSRRDVLGLGSAALAALTGCVGESPAGTESPTAERETAASTTERTPTTDSIATETPDADVRLRDVAVTPSLVALNSPDSIGTYGDRDEQFAVVDVGTRGRLPFDADAFALAADERTLAPTTADALTGHYALWEREGPYEPGAGGFLLFRLPKPLDADRAAVRWPNGDRALSDDALARLNRPPTTFAVREFAAPDAVTNGSEATLTLTVENTGDADGTFVAGLNRTGPRVAYTPVRAVSLDVAAGASTTWTHSYAPSVPSPEGDLSFDFVLNWRGGDERVGVDVEPRE